MSSLEKTANVVPHLLSFVSNPEGDMVTVHLDADGLDFLIEQLTILKQLLHDGQCEHIHLFTTDSIGEELSSTRIKSNPAESTVIQHVKLNCWTREWAEKHMLIKTS